MLGNHWKPVEIVGNPLKSLEIIGNHLKSLEIIGTPWKSLEINGNHWKSYELWAYTARRSACTSSGPTSTCPPAPGRRPWGSWPRHTEPRSPSSLPQAAGRPAGRHVYTYKSLFENSIFEKSAVFHMENLTS